MEGQNYILGIAGRKGSGKSTWAREHLEGINRLAIIDTLAEHADIVQVAEGTLREQVTFLASQRNGNFKRCFLLPPEGMLDAFNYLCKAAYMCGNMTVLLEEVDYFSKPSWNADGLDLLVRYGRHANVNLIYTVRNLVETSRRLTSQTDVFVFFRIDEPRYLDEIENRLGAEVASSVAQLGEHESIVVSRAGDTWQSGE